MKISKYELIGKDELLARLKRTRLKGFDRPFIYENASLEWIEGADPRTLVPAQQYILTENVERILRLVKAFEAIGLNLFDLPGGLFFTPEGSETPIPFIPPIIEESREANGETIRLINDGMHRVYAALKLDRPLNVILARRVPAEYPYYAYPLANGWSEVEEKAVLEEGYKKKKYRYPENYKAYFRDFNEVLPGVQENRPFVKVS